MGQRKSRFMRSWRGSTRSPSPLTLMGALVQLVTVLLACCFITSTRSKSSSLFVKAAAADNNNDDDDEAGGNFFWDEWFTCGLFPPDGCGLFNFASIVRSTDDPGASDCVERCLYFPGLESAYYVCGACGDSNVSPPTPPSPVTPTAPIAPEATTPAPAPSPPEGDFQITLDLQVRSEYQIYFTRAAERWEQVVTGGLADIDLRLRPEIPSPDDKDCRYPDVVDDLYICVFESKIDGPGGTAGFAGVTYFRKVGGLPILGYARFEPEDISQGLRNGWFQNLVIHEFGHNLGLGTAWDCPSDLFSNSPRANEEFQTISGCSSNALTEGNAFGASGNCIHWKKNDCFESEIMTNTIESNAKLSRITIAALDDMGYDVNYNAADDYTRSDLGSNCVCDGRKQNREKVRHLSALDDSFGDMPSSSPPKHKERILSEVGFQDAVAQGQAVLKTMVAPPLDGRSDGAQGQYIGDKFVFVYYIENNQLYSVYVEAE